MAIFFTLFEAFLLQIPLLPQTYRVVLNGAHQEPDLFYFLVRVSCFLPSCLKYSNESMNKSIFVQDPAALTVCIVM